MPWKSVSIYRSCCIAAIPFFPTFSDLGSSLCMRCWRQWFSIMDANTSSSSTSIRKYLIDNVWWLSDCFVIRTWHFKTGLLSCLEFHRESPCFTQDHHTRNGYALLFPDRITPISLLTPSSELRNSIDRALGTQRQQAAFVVNHSQPRYFLPMT